MAAAAKQFDESLVNFYEERLVSRADAVYRFAFALTLSLDGAQKCTERTFREVAANLEKIHGSGEPNVAAVLLAYCWRAYQDLKSQNFPEGQSAVTKALKPIALEPRAALAAVDIVGLAPADAAKVLAWQERDLRTHLAVARKALMMSSLDV